VAQADAAHPWDGQNTRAQHERDGAAPQIPDRHNTTTPSGGPTRPEHPQNGGHAAPSGRVQRPGSNGERKLQRKLGTTERAERFYGEQMLDHLNERMREFVQRQEMFFLATADNRGECDSSFRAGPPGFLQVLGERTLAYPEYRGNGVHASLGNIQENPHLGIMLIDFTRARIGLHINGRATIVEEAELRRWYPHLPEDTVPGRLAHVWVHVEVEEAYIHCAKHIPQLQKAPKRTARDWGTDDYKRKGGDFFGAAREARESGAVAVPEGTGRRRRPTTQSETPAQTEAPAQSAPSARTEPSAQSQLSARAELPVRNKLSAPAPQSAPEPSAQALPSVPAQRYGNGGTVRTSQLPSAPAGADPRSSVYDELPGYGREEAHAQQAPATATSTANRTDDAAAKSDRDAMWRIPEMPPPPQMPALSAGPSASSSPAPDPARTTEAPWTGSSNPAPAADSSTAAASPSGSLSPAVPLADTDPEAWRQEAERALAEAQRRGAVNERSSFQGWFG
jgi:predicted pyridoxine 5'-phosphate oxidase superfamily flavin-nucleotide-binding protein